jgi:hypothetical protein
MKPYPGLEDLNTRDCALEGSELFGTTKRKLDLPPGVNRDSHRPDKVNTPFIALMLGLEGHA